jgi:asparagine synthase (glutamine-hydrolysing)
MEGVRQLLSYGAVRQPRTILEGVSMLRPGHLLQWSAGRSTVAPYWSLATNRRPELQSLAESDVVRAVESALEESTRLQMVSDAPLGAFLSGGIDSALIVSLMARQLSRPLKTFSVGFEAEGAPIDESDRAAAVAGLLGTEHTRVLVRGSDVRDELPKIAKGLDQPSADGVNSYFVSKAARTGVTVAISGTGGDELFCGYPWWFTSIVREEEFDSHQFWRASAKRLGSRVASAGLFDRASTLPWGGSIRRLRGLRSWPARFAIRNLLLTPADVAQLIARELHDAAAVGSSYDEDFEDADILRDAAPLERISGLCVSSYMNDQLLRDIDAVSMSHSLEVRVPFLDPMVADLALGLPAWSKLPPGEGAEAHLGKAVLRRILASIHPSLSLPPAKSGFNFPMAAWLRGPLRDAMLDILSPARVARRGLLEPNAVRALADDFLAGRREWNGVWAVLMLHLWCDEVLDKTHEAATEPLKEKSRIS